MRVQLSQLVLFNVERRTHRASVNLLRSADDECSPVLFSLDRSEVEVTVLLQVYCENRLFLVNYFHQICAPEDAFLNDIGFGQVIYVCLQQDLATTLPALFRLLHDATQVRLLFLRFT